LEKDKLRYYVNFNLKQCKGEVVVNTITDVKGVDEYKGKKFVFGIFTTTGRTYYLQGSDEDNVTSWMDAISAAVSNWKDIPMNVLDQCDELLEMMEDVAPSAPKKKTAESPRNNVNPKS